MDCLAAEGNQVAAEGNQVAAGGNQAAAGGSFGNMQVAALGSFAAGDNLAVAVAVGNLAVAVSSQEHRKAAGSSSFAAAQ